MRLLTLGLASIVQDQLRHRGHGVHLADDLEDLASIAHHFSEQSQDSFEAIILGINDKQPAGAFSPRYIRKKGSTMPLIGLSDTREGRVPEERAIFLEQGGDDLLYEPVNFRELEATISAAVRRTVGHVIDIKYLMDERIKINIPDRVVTIDGKRVHLPAQEFDVLANMARNLRRLVTKENFMNDLYGGSSTDEADIKIIDVVICKIRAKFEQILPGSGLCIQTVWGRGYLLDDPLPVATAVAQ